MKDYKYALSQLGNQVRDITEQLRKAEKATQTFLVECGKVGITRVSIGKRSDLVPATLNWPFGCGGSVFQYPSETRGKDGWPAIWGVVGRLKISGGAGNSDQHQVANDDLMEGVFEKKGNYWRQIQ